MTGLRERPLAGRCIAITRPRDQADSLIQVLESLGAEVLSVPVIEIAPLQDVSALQDLARRLPLSGLAFFVSPNAVHKTLEVIPAAGWPEGLKVSAVGPGTAAALRQHGFADVIMPPQHYDSEGVLALAEFQQAAVAGQQVIVFRGDGGRPLLVDTLRARGAVVEIVSCYQRRRSAPDLGPLLTAFRAGRLDGIAFSSSEGVRFFADLVGTEGEAMLAALPVFAPHQRIADELRQAGAPDVILTAAGDAGIAAGIWRRLGSV